jgi:pilus assembly protein Flp/PilA
MRKRLIDFLRDEKGATAVEYSILAAAIAAVIVTVVFSIGGKVENLFDTVDSTWSE